MLVGTETNKRASFINAEKNKASFNATRAAHESQGAASRRSGADPTINWGEYNATLHQMQPCLSQRRADDASCVAGRLLGRYHRRLREGRNRATYVNSTPSQDDVCLS